MYNMDGMYTLSSHPLFEQSPDALLLLNRKGIIVHTNNAFQKLLGSELESIKHCTLEQLLEQESRPAFQHSFHHALTGENDQAQAVIQRRHGQRLQLELRMIPANTQEERMVYVILKDMTEQKVAAQMIEHMAYYDTLTGLPNRTLFQIQLTQELAAANSGERTAPFAIMMIGLDRFQLVNDSFGHSWGDMLLMQVSDRLREWAGDTHRISRMGNYEFALLVRHFDHTNDMVELARHLQLQLMEPYYVHDRELVISSSIGLAIYPYDGIDMNTLLRHAVKAQSAERAGGQGLFRLDASAETSASSLQQLEWEHDLRKALERGELELHYQPQYDIRDMRLIGMEALVRWRHPKHGLISPAQFIPLAEETGLIIPIGDWVLRTACRQNKLWQEAGWPALTVSVNLSLKQFQKLNLIGDIVGILQDTGLAPSCLELEITESVAMHNVEQVIRKLNELKGYGIRISMDDFGTGYSSLHVLKKIPIQKLKIDQSFIRDITTDTDSAAIVSTIIAMANHLNLDVVAEGVESEGDLQFLNAQNCPHAQGYYFSKPVSAAEFELIFASHK
ncbi:EAL domain-containing protein [Paenibacillus rigui]|uniref:Diguanylate cyclase n=1 Tax=Paenibacillus rigui TaxID=554312 RepID=A0A229UXZ4_9BACL|nr:EAL domain-containing protein [Paenibacillus rigui]OXM87819.1 diguanylate cyclase [Paenibacillus rigui]